MQQSPLVSTCCRSITFNLWSSKSNSHRPQSGEGFWSFRIPAMHPRNFGPENERKFEWEPSQICQPSNEQIQILTTWRNLGAMQGTRSSCAYAAASGEQHLACWEMYARSVELCTFPSNVSCFRFFSSWTVPSMYLFEASALGKDIWNNAPFLERKIAPPTSPHKGHKRTAADGCAAVRSFGMALRNGFLMLAQDLQEGHVIMGQWAWHGKNHRLFVPNFNDAKSPNLPCFIFQIQLEKQNLLMWASHYWGSQRKGHTTDLLCNHVQPQSPVVQRSSAEKLQQLPHLLLYVLIVEYNRNLSFLKSSMATATHFTWSIPKQKMSAVALQTICCVKLVNAALGTPRHP